MLALFLTGVPAVLLIGMVTLDSNLWKNISLPRVVGFLKTLVAPATQASAKGPVTVTTMGNTQQQEQESKTSTENESNSSTATARITAETVTLPGNTCIGGIGFIKNKDGTTTYFPRTTVGFFSTRDYVVLKENLPPDEFALLEANLVRGIFDRKEPQCGKSLPKERREALDLRYSIKEASDKEYLFVATRHLYKEEVVGTIHLSLGTKDEDIAESDPAQIDITRFAEIDVYRGKSEIALRNLLTVVRGFFSSWALFQIQLDEAENHGLDYLSCEYELHIPLPLLQDADYQGVRNMVGKVLQGEFWMRPTTKMIEEWGLNTTEKRLCYSDDRVLVVWSNCG